MKDTNQPPPPVSPPASALDAPIGGAGQTKPPTPADIPEIHTAMDNGYPQPCDCEIYQTCEKCRPGGRPPPPATGTPARTLAEDDEIRLRPCPFCGGTARYGESPDGGVYVDCSTCFASTSLMYPMKCDVRPLLAEKWNHRQPKPVAGRGERQGDATTDRLRELRIAAAVAMLPNENSTGEWKAKRHGDGPEWMILGPRYATRPSRVVLAVTELDGFTKEESHRNNRAVAEFLASAANYVMSVLDEQPAPVAAGGAGQGERRWGVAFDCRAGRLGPLIFETEEAAANSAPETISRGRARVVPVLVTVLEGEGGAEGAGGNAMYQLRDGNVTIPPALTGAAGIQMLLDRISEAEAARAAAEGERDVLRALLMTGPKPHRKDAKNGWREHDGELEHTVQTSECVPGCEGCAWEAAKKLALAPPAGGAADRDGGA